MRLAAFAQQYSQLADWRKHFLIPVRALRVVRGLLQLDDFAIFREDTAGEPGEHRPGQIEHAGNLGAAYRQHHKGAVARLGGVDRRVAEPDAEHRLIAARPHPKRLIRIFRAHRHQVACRPGAATQVAYDDGFTQRRPLVGPRKTVVHFHPAIAETAAEKTRRDLAGGPAVQELVVHVHQVLVHEAVVALHELSKAPRLVSGVGCGADARERFGGRRHAGPDENDAVTFEAGIGADAVRQFPLAEIGHVDAAAGRVIAPAMIAAADGAAVDGAFRERHLPVRAAILQRERRSVPRTYQYDRLARKTRREGLAGFQFARPRDRIPIIRMRADTAKVGQGSVGIPLVH